MGRAIDRFRRATARRLRAEATSAEQRLWSMLDRIPLDGTHFRRQVPIGPYVADFVCLGHRLVIELDGPSHATPEGQARDRIRTAFLENEGFRVIRFWNQDVYDNLEGVLETIWLAITPASPVRSEIQAAERSGERLS